MLTSKPFYKIISMYYPHRNAVTVSLNVCWIWVITLSCRAKTLISSIERVCFITSCPVRPCRPSTCAHHFLIEEPF